jgi:hypothetical protein
MLLYVTRLSGKILDADSCAKIPYFRVYPYDNLEEDFPATHTISYQNYNLHFKLLLKHINEETSFSHLQHSVTGMHRKSGTI